jgi:hypothetical protein
MCYPFRANLHGNDIAREQVSAHGETMKKRFSIVCRTSRGEGNLGAEYGLRPTKDEGGL